MQRVDLSKAKQRAMAKSTLLKWYLRVTTISGALESLGGVCAARYPEVSAVVCSLADPAWDWQGMTLFHVALILFLGTAAMFFW